MKTLEKNDVINLVKEKGVKFIQLWFADILGSLKSFTITGRELDGALDMGKGFDGSSITGYAEAEESDIIAMPDPSTFQILPWETSTGRMFCDILNPDRSPYPGDPRYVLKRMVKRAGALGFTYHLGPELEYFYFKNSQSPEVLDEGGYFDLTAVDIANNVRKQTVETLEAMSIPVECDHHEVAPSQHEIDLQFAEALTMADNAMTYRMVVKEIAQRNGIYATFMPKPLFGVCGSGMHAHQSLRKGGKNIFFDAKDKYHLSKTAKEFIAGQLKHAREICSILAQWVNSYKRLVPGFEAPVYISWAQRNRTALIRVPLDKPGKEEAMRAEIRCPDPACNPYLAFAVMLAAGLEGIEKNYKCPDPVEPNIYKMEATAREDMGLEALPVNLFEAISETEGSDLVKRTLGDHVFTRFIHNKKNEWNEDRVQVTSHEIKRYLSIL